MKKIWILALGMILLFGLSGCAAAGTGQAKLETVYYQVEKNQIGHLSVTVEKTSGRLDLHIFPTDNPEQNVYTELTCPVQASRWSSRSPVAISLI